MFFFRLLNFFKKSPESSSFLYRNIFSILKHSLKSIGGEEDDLKNFERVSQDKFLQRQFSQNVHASYFQNLEAARYRDAKIVLRKGTNFRADLMFYSVVVGFVASTFVVIFFKNSLSPDGIAFFSALAGISGSFLRDIFGFEFGTHSLSCKSDDFFDDFADDEVQKSIDFSLES